MFHSVASAASKVAGAASNTVSGTVSFSEHEVMKHVWALTGLRSRSAAQEYVVKEFENIKETAPGDVDVDVDVIPASAAGSDLKNVVLKVSPKNNNNANNKNNSVLVSSGLNALGEGVDDDSSSNVAVMLELARGVSRHGPDGLKNSIIFFFNIGEEEEGLDAAHPFITKHPWNEEIRVAIDLEGLGIGGGNKHAVNQASVSEKASGGLKDPVIVLFGNNGEGQQPLKQGIFPAQTRNMKEKPLTLQDIFNEGTGSVQSTTDFQAYRDIGGLSGINFSQGQGSTTVYHTKNDKFELLKVGSIKNLGENMLSFLLQVNGGPEHKLNYQFSSQKI